MCLFLLCITFSVFLNPLGEAGEKRRDQFRPSDDEFTLGKYEKSSLFRKKRIVAAQLEKTNFTSMYVASVQRISNKEHLCMATLITLRTLISSCSCFIHVPGKGKEIPIFEPQLYMVVAGTSDLAEAKMSDSRVVSQFYRDPICHYSPEMETWQNNRGYIELQRPFQESNFLKAVQFSKSQIEYNKIFKELYESSDFTVGGKKFCTTYGWGAKRYNLKLSLETKYSSRLGKMNVQFLTNSKCFQTLNSTFEMKNMLCVSGIKKKKVQKGLLCSKDQGAPLICDDTLIAIGTPLIRCGYKGKLSFFQKLNITQMLDFSTLEKVIIAKANKHHMPIFLLTLLIVFIVNKNS